MTVVAGEPEVTKLAETKSPINTGVSDTSFVYEVMVSVAEKLFAPDILTLSTVFPVETEAVGSSIKSKTTPETVLPSFLIIVFPEKSFAIAEFKVKNIEFAPNLAGSLLYETEVLLATVTTGILAYP